MNRLLNKILISVVVLCGILLFGADVFAQPADPLVVQFEKSPLFSETSFLPGDTVMRWIKVSNYSGQTQKISVQAINVNDPDGLGSVLPFQIRQGANILYNGTLAGFFADGEVYLSNLANGDMIQYDFYVTFDSASGDEYAGKILGFDFQIGFQGPGLAITNETNGGGGGGGSLTSILTGDTTTNENGTGGGETPEGQVLGEATFRTSLPETGGIMNWLFNDKGPTHADSGVMETNILIAGIFILVMIGLVMVRRFVLK